MLGYTLRYTIRIRNMRVRVTVKLNSRADGWEKMAYLVARGYAVKMYHGNRCVCQ